MIWIDVLTSSTRKLRMVWTCVHYSHEQLYLKIGRWGSDVNENCHENYKGCAQKWFLVNTERHLHRSFCTPRAMGRMGKTSIPKRILFLARLLCLCKMEESHAYIPVRYMYTFFGNSGSCVRMAPGRMDQYI